MVAVAGPKQGPSAKPISLACRAAAEWLKTGLEDVGVRSSADLRADCL
jgi:hypothetical protein